MASSDARVAMIAQLPLKERGRLPAATTAKVQQFPLGTAAAIRFADVWKTAEVAVVETVARGSRA